jgi:hypothetical protein
MPPIEVGAVFQHPYPFVRDSYDRHEVDGDVVFTEAVPSWKPGTVGDYDTFCPGTAHGIGMQALTVVGVFKPGRFPERVFYTQRFITPDGHEFGKGKLRITTMHAFKRLSTGYRYEYEVEK